jgi:hypothetical protein
MKTQTQTPLYFESLTWRKKYESHIRSTRWKAMKKAVIKMRGNKCEECGYGSPNLELHHLTYERFGRELWKDVKLVCKQCHPSCDEQRKKEIAKNRENRMASNAFETWYKKTRGDTLGEATEFDYEEFDNWCENKDNQIWV